MTAISTLRRLRQEDCHQILSQPRLQSERMSQKEGGLNTVLNIGRDPQNNYDNIL